MIVFDILLLTYTHIKTIKIVLKLLGGFQIDDKEYNDPQADLDDAKRKCNLFACCCSALYLCINKCNMVLHRYKEIAVKLAYMALTSLLGLLGVAIFVAAIFILTQVIAALLTRQAVRFRVVFCVLWRNFFFFFAPFCCSSTVWACAASSPVQCTLLRWLWVIVVLFCSPAFRTQHWIAWQRQRLVIDGCFFFFFFFYDFLRLFQ